MYIYTLFIYSQIGGNKAAHDFFEEQSDWDDTMTIQQRYNTKAAALYRDKVSFFLLPKSTDIS